MPRDVVRDTGATRLNFAVLDYARRWRPAPATQRTGLTTVTVRRFTTGEYYRNGFPIDPAAIPTPDSFTLERLEVIRGLNTSCYGQGDPGSTFNVVPAAKPNRA